MATIAVGQYTISKVYDGKDGANGKDGADGKSAVVAILSNESHTLTANSSGAISSYSGASTKVTVYDGATDVTSKCTITKSESGVSGTLSGSSYSVTSVTNGVGGIVTFTIKYNSITIIKTFSISVSKQGTKGDTGAAGADGKSIRSITLQYAVSPNKNVAPETGWTNEIPTRNAGEYLWVRDYIVYSDDSAENVGARNVTGDVGSDGVSIVSVKSYFAVSTSNSSAPVNGWQDTMPTRNKGEYLWRKDYITYSNGNAEYTTAVVISGTDGKDGSKGDPGTAGVGVASIVEQYYKSTSATSLSGGSWSGTYPGWENGKYIWTKSIITYTDGSSDETTPVCVSGSKGSTGATGATGKGISKTVVEYQTSSSGTTTPTGTWQTTVPSVSAGQYLWTRTTITYTDNSTSVSYSVARTGTNGTNGTNGKDGANGADGIGVSSTNVTYQKSTSGTTVPTGTWQTTIPSVEANNYLWTRTEFVYTDGSKKYAYSVGKMGATGAKGDTGATGKGISSITEYYLATSASSGVTTSTSGWTTTVQSMTATNKYLWNYEVITYTDSSTSTNAPRIMGVYGDKGQTGNTGKGIKSIVNKYLATASASGVTISTSGWTDTIQTITVDKKYLWNYEIITYTDNSSTKTTPVIIGVYGNTGQKGDTGATGNGISSVDVYYYLSTSATELAGGSWSTTAPAWVNGKYMWSKTKTTYTNGTTKESEPACITGAKGSTGATGTAAKVCNVTPSAQVFKSTTGANGTFLPQYIYLYPTFQNCTFSKWQYSTDGTTWTNVTSGSHSMTVGTYSSVANSLRLERNSDLYTSSNSTISFKCVTNQSVAYDTVSIIKVYDVTELNIGGRNLVLNSSFLENTLNWGNWGSPAKREIVSINNKKWLHCVCTSSSYQGLNQRRYNVTELKDILPNTKYTLSFTMYASQAYSGDTCGIHWMNAEGGIISQSWCSVNLTTSAKRFKFTYTTPSNCVDFNLMIGKGLNSTELEYWITDIKLELGNVATDCTPAPEDIENRLDDLGSTKTASGTSVSVVSADSLISVKVNGNNGSTGITGDQTVTITNAGTTIDTIKLPLGSIVLRATSDGATRDCFERRDLDNISQWCKIEKVNSSGTALSVENVIPIDNNNDLVNALDKLDVYRVPVGTNVITSSSRKVYFNVKYYPNTDDNNNIVKEINIYIDKINKRNAQIKTTVDAVEIEAYNTKTTLTQKIEGNQNDISNLSDYAKSIDESVANLKVTSTEISSSVSSLRTELEGNYSTKEELLTQIEATNSKITQTSKSWMYELQKVGGDNMVKNSVMINGTNFWTQHLVESYYESANPPNTSGYDTSLGDIYWFCTLTNGNYKNGTIYKYNGSAWVETTLTRAQIINMKNPFFYVHSVKTEESQNKTISGYMMQYDINNQIQSDGTVKNTNVNKASAEGTTGLTNAETHIFNATNIMDYKNNEEDLTYSFKIRNNISVGQVYCGVAFINRPLNANAETVESIYEPCTIITPDDDREGFNSEYQTVKMPKESDYIGIRTIAEFYVSNTVPTLSEVYSQGKFWLCNSTQTVTINGASVSLTAGKMYYCRAINVNGTMKLSVVNKAFNYHGYWLCTSSNNSSYVAGTYYRANSGNTAITASTPSTSNDYIFQVGDGIGILKYRSGSNWVTRTDVRKVYNLDSGEIWTFRNIYGAYYRTSIAKSGVKFYGIYFIVSFYGGLLATSGSGAPTSSTTPTLGVYYIDTTYNSSSSKYTGYVWRPKYKVSLNADDEKVYTFDKWENTGISANFTLTNYMPPEFPLVYNIPAIGNFDISDIKVEYSSIPTRWTQHPSEVYGLNYKMDESGFSIVSGSNKMNIDEDTIIATYENTKVFGISGDVTDLNKARVNRLILEPFEEYIQEINGTKYLILN